MNVPLGFNIFLFFLSLNCLIAKGSDRESDSLRIHALYDAGRGHFFNGMYLQALDSFNLSLQLGKEVMGPDHRFLRNINNALGITYINLGDFDNSLECFLETERSYLVDSTTAPTAIARIYNNIGNLYLGKLNYPLALDYYQRAVQIFLNQHEKDMEGIADIYYSMANIYYHQNEYDRVIETAENYASYSRPDTRLLFMSLVAASYKEQKENDKALESYRKTIAYARKIYDETDLNVIFECLVFTHFLIDIQDFNLAESMLGEIESLLSRRGSEDSKTLALYYKTRGLYWSDLSVETGNLNQFRTQKSFNLERAVSYYKKGLEVLGTDPDQLQNASVFFENTLSLIRSLEILNLIADTYIQKADLFAEFSRDAELESVQKALEFYVKNADIISQARRAFYSDESKMQLGELKEATFMRIVRTASRMNALQPDPEVTALAFENAERMKASAVFDRLSEQFAKENSLVPDSLSRLERNLNYNITRENERLFNLKHSTLPDSAEAAKADSVLFHLNRQRDELHQYIETNYPDYYTLKYSRVTVRPGEIQEKLKNNEVLLEYVVNETDSVPEVYAFCFSRSSSGFHRLAVDSGFIQTLQEVYHFMADPDFLFTDNSQSQHFCASAHALYEQLIAPFAGMIQNKKLIIVPDGKLNYLPFDALLTEMPDTAGTVYFNRLPYLIRKHAIQYSYSSSLLYGFSEEKPPAEKRLLAFAPEYHSDTVVVENEQYILTPLPGVQREVDLISKKIQSRLYRGNEATELLFRQECTDYDILHLAMHAFINDSLPAFSRLAFTRNLQSTPENDGWLNTADIYNFDLSARLAVLSACSTGQGNLKRGEGVMSLARGFLYAGCRTLVMTLWDVEDAAGTKIMHSFYRHLKKGRTPGESIRQAKLNYLENANARLAHPHYWLGYVSIGNDSPLFTSYDVYFFILLLLSLIGITIDQILRLKRKK